MYTIIVYAVDVWEKSFSDYYKALSYYYRVLGKGYNAEIITQ